MSLPVNAHWRPAPKGLSWPRRCLIGVVLAIAAALAAQWLAGYFFLWSFHLPPRRATPLTVSRYAALPHSRAIAASFATVFMLRAVPSPAAGMRNLERPIPSG